MKIFMINLPSSTDRRLFMEKQFKKYKLNFELVEAVNGKVFTQEEMMKLADLEHIKQYSKYFTVGAVGLCLTHKKVYEMVVQRNLPYALVIEDDIVINKDFESFLNKIEPLIQPGEIILLYYKKLNSRKIGKFSNLDSVIVDDNHKLLYPLDEMQFDMACAFIVTKEAAQGIINVNTPVKVVADSWHYFYRNGGLKKMRCIYPAVTYPADFKSTIEYAEVRYGMLNKVLKFIDENKIFPFYQILKKRRAVLRKKTEFFEFSNEKSVFVK
jgi:glycosyl transferase, family 25